MLRMSEQYFYARALIESRSIEYQMILVIMHYCAMITFSPNFSITVLFEVDQLYFA